MRINTNKQKDKMNPTKPVLKSKTVLTLLGALLVPTVMELVGLNIPLEQLNILKMFLSDHVLTLDELIQGIMIIIAVIFRIQGTKRLTVFGKLASDDTLVS